MSISWLSSKPTPIVDYSYDDSDEDDDDDDVSVLGSTQPSNNDKGKAIQTDYGDDEIQIIFDSSSNCGNKKRKFSNIGDQDSIFEETLFQKGDLEANKETVFVENQVGAKKWRNLSFESKELVFVDTLVEKDHVEAKQARKLNIDDDGDEVEVPYWKILKDNVFGELGAVKEEILVEKDQPKPEKEEKFDMDAELQLIYSFPEIYMPEFSNLKNESDDLFGEVGVDDANVDEDETILPSSSKGKGILVESDELNPNNGRSLGFDDDDDDDDDDDEVQVSNLRPKIYVGEPSKSKHENDNLLEKVGVDDATGDLSLLVMCEICTDEKPKVEFLTVMGCDHSYCSECVARYVASKLQENVVEITCPALECAGVLGPEHCRCILPAEVYDRWGLALCEEIISPGQKFYCPYNDCSALMIDDTQETGEVITRMECPNCQRMFCVKCKVSWHKELECEEFQRLNEDERGQADIMLVKLAKKNLWKRCPKCKMYVQRTQGCNAMRCRCGCRFCYACGNLAQTCQCIGGYAHRLPIEPGILPVRQMYPHAIPPLNNRHVNQTLTNPPDQFPQGDVGVQFRALQARIVAERVGLQRPQYQYQSANQTQYHRTAPYLLQGRVGGSLNSSQARRGPVEDGPSVSQSLRDLVMRGFNISEARQGPVGGGRNNSEARQGSVAGGRNNSEAGQGSVAGDRNNSEARQGPVGGGCNNSEAGQGPVGGDRYKFSRRQDHVMDGLNISQSRQDPVEDGLNLSQSRQGPVSQARQGSVGGGRNNSLRRQDHVRAGLNISEVRQNPVEDGLNLSQSRRGPVEGGLNISQARQGYVGGGFTPSQVLQQQHRRMPQLIQSASANQTLPNPSSQFPQGPVEGCDNTSQARQQFRRLRRMRELMQNLSANQTQPNPSSQLTQGAVGGVGGRDSTSQARQQARELRRGIRMALRNSLTNQTQPNPSSQFGQISDNSVVGRNNTSQARLLERIQSRMMYGLQNLPGNQTLSNANIQPAESSSSNQ